MEEHTMFDLVIRTGERPDPITFPSMIDEYCLVTEMERTFRVLDAMVSLGVSPSVITHDLFLSMVMLSSS